MTGASLVRRPNRGRWALSFADLCLLLLGFFVLLQANQATREKALAGIGSYFGAIQAPQAVNLDARKLFLPGDALLTPQGREALFAAIRPLMKTGEIIQIQSIGVDRGERRFDAWDLAAARLGATARELVAAGIPQGRLRISGLAEDADGKAPGRQIIRIAPKTLATSE